MLGLMGNVALCLFEINMIEPLLNAQLLNRETLSKGGPGESCESHVAVLIRALRPTRFLLRATLNIGAQRHDIFQMVMRWSDLFHIAEGWCDV